MAEVGYHASHEQFGPGDLLSLVQRADRAGFACAMCSDHFQPWSAEQGHSGHAWTWLGSAMATTPIPFGVVTCPFGRYHPAVIAQAAATLAEMHVDRFWMAVGSGEALNETITGARWPAKDERNARLKASVEVMRALWNGEEVTCRGHIVVEHARLYSLPPQPPQVFAAALSEKTARWAAQWADGLITISMPRDKLRKVLEAYREGGGEDKPVYLQVKLSYAGDEKEALHEAYTQWRTNVLAPVVSEELWTPGQFAAAAEHVREEDMRKHLRVSSDLQRHLGWLQEDLELGVDQLYLHNVNRGQERFIDDFGAHVLPALQAAR